MTHVPEPIITKPGLELEALLRRAIARELSQHILPELTSADAIERGTFAKLLLQNLAADLDVLPGVAAELIPQLRQSIEVAISKWDTT